VEEKVVVEEEEGVVVVVVVQRRPRLRSIKMPRAAAVCRAWGKRIKWVRGLRTSVMTLMISKSSLE
jgi:hypothetical protein